MKNKNNIQSQLSNKKRRRTFLIFGASLLAAGAVAIPTALILTNSKPSSEIQITFNGNFEKSNSHISYTIKRGSTLADLLKDKEKANAIKTSDPYKDVFCGWAKTSEFKNGKITLDVAHPEKQILSATQKINESVSLTAIYKSNITNYDELTWAQLIFNPDTEGKATIAGNVWLEVPIGIASITFGSINKPSCEPPTGSSFLGWSTDGTAEKKIEDSAEITQSMNLFPILTPAETITFHPGTGGEIESGSAEVPIVGTNVKFGDINVPKLKWTGEGTKYFAGWYSQTGEGGTWDESKLYTNTTPLTVSCQAYARWVSDDDDSFSKVFAVVPDGETAEGFYDSNTTFMVKKDTPWKNFNHPNPTIKTKEVTGWKYSTDYDPAEKKGTWNDVDPNSTVFNTSPTYILPTLETAVKDMQIVVLGQTSATTPLFEQNQVLTVQAYTFPESLSQEVSAWEVYKEDETKATSDEVAIIADSTDKSKATIQIKSADIQVATIKATSKIDSKIVAERRIQKLNPFEKKMDFFTNINGISYNLRGIDDKYASDITLESIDGKTVKETKSKSEFNYPIYIGDHISEIPNGFLANCTAFDNTITQSDNGKPITTIGSNFMLNCTSYNHTEVQNLIKYATTIGSHFMENCTSFKGPDEGLTFPVVISIGDYFMHNDTAFESALYFKSQEANAESNLTTIGNYFLTGCSAFHSDIELPESLKSLGCGCMFGCDNFAEQVIVNCDVSTQGFEHSVEMFATKNASSPFATTGFRFNGIHSQEAIAAWPALDGTKSSGNIRNSTEFDKEIDAVAVDATKPPQLSYVHDTNSFNMEGMGIIITYKDGTKKKISWDGTGTCPWTSSIAQGGKVGGVGTENVTFTYTSPTGAYTKSFQTSIYKYEPTAVTNVVQCKLSKGTTFTLNSQYHSGGNLWWSLDGSSWTELQKGVSASFWGRSIVFLRGNNEQGFSPYSQYGERKIDVAGEITLGGKVTGLITNGAAWDQNKILPNWCFYALFGSDSTTGGKNNSIIGIESGFFNAQKAGSHAYQEMFKGCTALKTVDSTLGLTDCSSFEGVCNSMFLNCPALTTVADNFVQSVTKLGSQSFRRMFMGCTSLTKFNSIISASDCSGTECCYSMFDGCTSLEAVPTNMLDAVTVVGSHSLRSMFWGCEKLTQIPMQLKATTAAEYCYAYMFSGCKALKVAPQIALKNATADYCCYLMFSGCESLKVYNDGTGTAFVSFTNIWGNGTVNGMFENTGGDFKTNPVAGGTYSYN